MSDPDETRDAAHWAEVEEAVELLVERRIAEALPVLRDVIKASPRNAYAYHHLGNALYEAKQLEAARDAYRAAVRVAPDYLAARVGLSHALRGLGDKRGAAREASNALRRFPNDADALYAAGLAYEALGDVELTYQYLQAFLDTHPELELQLEVRSILESMKEP